MPSTAWGAQQEPSTPWAVTQAPCPALALQPPSKSHPGTALELAATSCVGGDGARRASGPPQGRAGSAAACSLMHLHGNEGLNHLQLLQQHPGRGCNPCVEKQHSPLICLAPGTWCWGHLLLQLPASTGATTPSPRGRTHPQLCTSSLQLPSAPPGGGEQPGTAGSSLIHAEYRVQVPRGQQGRGPGGCQLGASRRPGRHTGQDVLLQSHQPRAPANHSLHARPKKHRQGFLPCGQQDRERCGERVSKTKR